MKSIKNLQNLTTHFTRLSMLGILLTCSGYAQLVDAKCDSILLGDVTENLWQEAYEAEKNIYALRLSAEALFREFLNTQEFSFTDENGVVIPPENFNIEKFKELVMSLTPAISDFHHFGISIPIVTRPTDLIPVEMSSQLIGQISNQLSAEDIMNWAQKVASNVLVNIENQIPIVFRELRGLVAESYVPLQLEFRNQGLDHENLYNMKATFVEINNYSARLVHTAKHGKKGIGFL